VFTYARRPLRPLVEAAAWTARTRLTRQDRRGARRTAPERRRQPTPVPARCRGPKGGRLGATGGAAMRRILLPGLVAVLNGCAAGSYWGDPAQTPATKADMATYQQDAFECVKQSKQNRGFGEFGHVVARDAQRLYVFCMRARGYTVQAAD